MKKIIDEIQGYLKEIEVALENPSIPLSATESINLLRAQTKSARDWVVDGVETTRVSKVQLRLPREEYQIAENLSAHEGRLISQHLSLKERLANKKGICKEN